MHTDTASYFRPTQPLSIRTTNPESADKKEDDTPTLSPYSLRMRLMAVPPDEARPSEDGWIGQTERQRVNDMQWVGLLDVSGGNEEPLGPWTGTFSYDKLT